MSGVFVDVDSKEIETKKPDGSMEDVKPVLACRACLAVERPLRPITKSVAETISQLTGNLIPESDLFPRYICSYCHALLVKFAAFRDKYQSVQATLYGMCLQDVAITPETIKFLADECPYPDFVSCIFVHSLPDDNKKTLKNEPCESDNGVFFTEKLINVIDKDFQYDVLVKNYNNPSDSNYSDDDGEFLINFVGRNEENIKEVDENVTVLKNKQNTEQKNIDEYLGNKINSEKKLRTKRNLIQKSKIKTQNVNEDKIKTKTKRKPESAIQSKKSKKLEVENDYNTTIVPLSKEEQIKQIEARKESLNYKEAIFRCDRCYHGFNLESTFKNHAAKHAPSQGDHECDICGLRYPTRKLLMKHKSASHINNYICNFCGVINKSSTLAKRHFDWHNGVKYDCKVCGKTFNKPNSVLGHMHLSHGGDMPCTICNEMFIGVRGLQQHMLKIHKKAIGAVCSICSVQFHSVEALRRHRPEGRLCDHTLRACAECGENFPSARLLRKHKTAQHERQFLCNKCDKRFFERSKYLSHMKQHVKPRNAPRKLSNPGFTSNVGRKPTDHDSTSELDGNMYVCEICGCNKKTRQTLANHLMTHTGERPFQCDYCSRRFICKSSLKKHIESHMVKSDRASKVPLKDYHCRVCNMAFSYRNNCQRHEKTVHQHVRRYNCQMCGSSYKFRESLKQHVNTKHLGIPWPKRNRRGPKREQPQAFTHIHATTADVT